MAEQTIKILALVVFILIVLILFLMVVKLPYEKMLPLVGRIKTTLGFL